MAKRFRWYKIFDSSEEAMNAFPNRRLVKVMTGDKYICFTRNNDRFYAFENQCPHQGKPLIHGECTEDNTVICPFHQYRFNLETGQGQGLYLPIYPVEVRDDGVYVGIQRGFFDLF